VLPLSGDSDTDFLIQGRRRRRAARRLHHLCRIVNKLLRDDGDLKRGRLFADRERPTVVVNESMAKRFPRRRVGSASAPAEGPWMTIVGIVADVQVRGARQCVVETTFPIGTTRKGV
jgi:hypothetical protein